MSYFPRELGPSLTGVRRVASKISEDVMTDSARSQPRHAPLEPQSTSPPSRFRFGALRNVDIDIVASEDEFGQKELYPDAEWPSYNEYFLPGEGIDREVIQSEICRYLGQDATCKPGAHTDI